MDQASSETSSGFPYKLTEADRAKGRSTVTPKRIRANRLNPVKSGKYSKHLNGDFLYCNSCSMQKSCMFFHRDSNCRIANISTYKNVAGLWKADPEDFLKEISRAFMELHTAIKVSGSEPKNLANYVSLLIRMFETKFGRRHLIGLQSQEKTVITYATPYFLKDKPMKFVQEKNAVSLSKDVEWLNKRLALYAELSKNAKERLEKLKRN